ncbi:MAG: hypothetical protein M3067_02235 [Chloroflexota bacterium]|nr:hypothetical protein [Chloroflexota bacterium]
MLSLELANALSRDRRQAVEEALRVRALREASEARRREERAAAVATPPTGLTQSQPAVARAR